MYRKSISLSLVKSPQCSNIDLHKKFRIVPLYMRRNSNLLKLMHTYLTHNITRMKFPWGVPLDGATRDGSSGPAIQSRVTRQITAPYILSRYPDPLAIKLPETLRGPNYG